VEAISQIDWPKSKLEVLQLLEEGDEETINAALLWRFRLY
jgi:hypothetical protein